MEALGQFSSYVHCTLSPLVTARMEKRPSMPAWQATSHVPAAVQQTYKTYILYTFHVRLSLTNLQSTLETTSSLTSFSTTQWRCSSPTAARSVSTSSGTTLQTMDNFERHTESIYPFGTEHEEQRKMKTSV